jgi:uncharacterized RDD family membrane protein YckC
MSPSGGFQVSTDGSVPPSGPQPSGGPEPSRPAAPSGGTLPQTSWTQSLTSTTPVPGPPGFYYADVPNRIIAFIIDMIILTVIGFLLVLVLGGLFGGLTTPSGALDSAGGELNLGVFLFVSIAQLAVSLAYFGYFWTSSRGTPGMKLLGLQIGHEIDGRNIDWHQAIVRWFIIGIPSILSSFASYASTSLSLILSLVGLVWLIVLLYTMAQSPTKQGLQDRYAHTILVKAGRRAA